jgi:methylthioribose-1-phosphate isomerase
VHSVWWPAAGLAFERELTLPSNGHNVALRDIRSQRSGACIKSQRVKVGGRHFRTIWLKPGDECVVQLIDQRFLPHEFAIEEVHTVEQMATAIREMHVRGAGLIGASAGYGMYLAAMEAAASDSFDEHIARAAAQLRATRPTAVNLSWAIDRQLKSIADAKTSEQKIASALRTAKAIADEDSKHCRAIGQQGLKLIREIARRKRGKTINVLTHCNAGWLAFVDHGSATAPIYAAHDSGLSVHVWVSETRPRNQGSKLTAWELGQHGVPHTLIADSAAGHVMQRGDVDLVIVGSDRTTCTGDVANKIGTYLKALAAHDNNVPFYVALPSSSIDWNMREGIREIPIEERSANEIRGAEGWLAGRQVEVRVAPEQSRAANYGFDVTPRHLVSGLITERGVCEANEKSIFSLFPEHAP